jgi:hypothetical protein
MGDEGSVFKTMHASRIHEYTELQYRYVVIMFKYSL